MARDEKIEYIQERLYLERDEVTGEVIIRRRPALPKARPETLRGVAERDESYCRIWNKRAHERLPERAGGSYVRMAGIGEMPKRRVIDALLSADNPRDCWWPDPFEAEAPDSMFRRQPKRSWNEEQKLRAEIRRALYLDGDVIRRKPVDAAEAARVHPALAGLAEGWNRRFADRPVAVREPGHSNHQYVSIGQGYVRLADVQVALGVEERGNT